MKQQLGICDNVRNSHHLLPAPLQPFGWHSPARQVGRKRPGLEEFFVRSRVNEGMTGIYLCELRSSQRRSLKTLQPIE
jgi:hypothetical protein